MRNGFVKTHGLGNDYLVFDEADVGFPFTANAVIRICDVHFGVGSDGILLKTKSDRADFGLRIFNPDGSEAEKSGNGLRIFAKFLYDYGFSRKDAFTVETKGGVVGARIVETENNKAKQISVDMGKAVFGAKEIPTAFRTAEVLGETIDVPGRTYAVYCVSVGNPHCVILTDRLDPEEVLKYGPALECHPLFPNRINVQFVKVLSRSEAEILIWERGAGHTLASGSSSCAVAAVLRKMDLTDGDVTVKMQGGALRIQVDGDWNIRMTGEARQIAQGALSDELLAELGP